MPNKRGRRKDPPPPSPADGEEADGTLGGGGGNDHPGYFRASGSRRRYRRFAGEHLGYVEHAHAVGSVTADEQDRPGDRAPPAEATRQLRERLGHLPRARAADHRAGGWLHAVHRTEPIGE